MNNFNRLARAAVNKSPAENLQTLMRKLRGPAPIQVPPSGPSQESSSDLDRNWVIPNIWKQPIFAELISARLKATPRHVLLIGQPDQFALLIPPLEVRGYDVTTEDVASTIGTTVPQVDYQAIYCEIPRDREHWRRVTVLKQVHGKNIIGIQELALPFTTIQLAQSKLNYFKRTTLDSVAPLYLGEKYFGPLDVLNRHFELGGKSVIEFGPFDGYQTAGLVHLGAKQVTCIEARAENFIKTSLAKYAFGWNNVEIIMDDMHNADANKYGHFDLAFAHGVYYHTIEPLIFLDNLLSLSDNIFIGGFCATDDVPPGPYERLEHDGRTYLAKKHPEGDDFTSGVNSHAYYFSGDDLMRFFLDHGYQVEIISDDPGTDFAGRFLRFLAFR